MNSQLLCCEFRYDLCCWYGNTSGKLTQVRTTPTEKAAPVIEARQDRDELHPPISREAACRWIRASEAELPELLAAAREARTARCAGNPPKLGWVRAALMAPTWRRPPRRVAKGARRE